MLEIILFAFFGVIACVTAIMVITRKNPIISALFLILNFAALAGLYLLLFAQFIAVVQIIVYAGAIMVLFLFVIMLLRP
ncbi:MAG: NADH-quinone oxidoreductase subunit J, partial [Ignavibacteria bacterium]|nr:NADH-quinone oxidoreductase subunit J [Ignavibacteria bacterium]